MTFCIRLLFLPAMACLCFGFTGETVVGNQTEQGNSVEIGFFTESLSIEGDFDGNGKKEVLSEKCMDCKSYQEREAEGTLDNKNSRAELLLVCSDRTIPQLTVTKQDFMLGIKQGFLLGLFLLKNEGDLNNDGTDEISFVLNHDDESAINTCFVYTYRRKQWQRLLSFRIWEWQAAQKPLLRKNKNGTITIFTSDDEANAIEKTVRLN